MFPYLNSAERGEGERGRTRQDKTGGKRGAEQGREERGGKSGGRSGGARKKGDEGHAPQPGKGQRTGTDRASAAAQRKHETGHEDTTRDTPTRGHGGPHPHDPHDPASPPREGGGKGEGRK